MDIEEHKKTYTRTGISLIAIGVLGFCIPFLSLNYFNRYSSSEVEAGKYYFSSEINSSLVGATLTVSPAPDYEHRNIKNRLVIAKIGVDMPIFQSESDSTLSKGGWIFQNSATPDKGGNTVIFGHRFKYLPPISNTFFNLDKVVIDDELQITWKNIVYRYRVIDTKIIEPTDLSILSQDGTARITLVTCTPLFSTKQRLVVVAEMI